MLLEKKKNRPGLIPSVFGDVTGAKIVMPWIMISLKFHKHEDCVKLEKSK